MYLYTDAIEFAPFGSEENRRSRRAEIVATSDDKVPRPSPKSIYRLADKVCIQSLRITSWHPASHELPLQYDVPALKTLALNHIRGGLAKCDIVEEAFSRFASRWVGHVAEADYLLTGRHRYEEIRNLYISQLAYVWMDDPTAEVICASIDKKIDSFVEEGLDHATEMLSALWDIANNDDAKAPANTPSLVSRF